MKIEDLIGDNYVHTGSRAWGVHTAGSDSDYAVTQDQYRVIHQRLREMGTFFTGGDSQRESIKLTLEDGIVYEVWGTTHLGAWREATRIMGLLLKNDPMGIWRDKSARVSLFAVMLVECQFVIKED